MKNQRQLGQQAARLRQVRLQCRWQIAAADLLLQPFPPGTEQLLRRGTETRPKRIVRREPQQPVQDLLHLAFRPASGSPLLASLYMNRFTTG